MRGGGGMSEELKAPFPWFGGKRKAASLIWPRFGNVPNYVEPFAGSLAVLLARPHVAKTETVNDADCFLANFWRATAADPESVSFFADSPVNEADLHARHRWLVDRVEFRGRMRSDPDYFDAKIAGWWVWGLCAWIGSGWCSAVPGGTTHHKLPELASELLAHSQVRAGLSQQLPHLSAGRERHAQRLGAAADGVERTKIREVFDILAARLRRCRVACGDFERVLSDSVTWRHGTTAILLDPPYADGAEVYAEGGNSTFARVATWAIEHGQDERLRICLCGYDGTFSPPTGWSTVEWKATGGYGSQRKDGTNENAKRERLWFSPGCLNLATKPRQPSLFSTSSEA